MDDYRFEFETDETAEVPEHKSCLSIYAVRISAFFLLVVLIAGTFRNFQKGADIRIVGITDHISRFQIEKVNISVRPAFVSQPGDQEEFYPEVKPPINLSVEGGECYDILVEASGYHDWKKTFCPSISERIYVEIDLIPKDLPPIRQNLYET